MQANQSTLYKRSMWEKYLYRDLTLVYDCERTLPNVCLLHDNVFTGHFVQQVLNLY